MSKNNGPNGNANGEYEMVVSSGEGNIFRLFCRYFQYQYLTAMYVLVPTHRL